MSIVFKINSLCKNNYCVSQYSSATIKILIKKNLARGHSSLSTPQPKQKVKKCKPTSAKDKKEGDVCGCTLVDCGFNTNANHSWPQSLLHELCGCFCAVLVCTALWNTAGLEGKSNKMTKQLHQTLIEFSSNMFCQQEKYHCLLIDSLTIS